MKTNRIPRFQLITLLIVAAALLTGCGPRDAGSNRSEGMDIIPVVSTSQIASNIANAVDYQLVVQDPGM
jgi:outer membrane biogenesis lipoprotein LolB